MQGVVNALNDSKNTANKENKLVHSGIQCFWWKPRTSGLLDSLIDTYGEQSERKFTGHGHQ